MISLRHIKSKLQAIKKFIRISRMFALSQYKRLKPILEVGIKPDCIAGFDERGIQDLVIKSLQRPGPIGSIKENSIFVSYSRSDTYTLNLNTFENLKLLILRIANDIQVFRYEGKVYGSYTNRVKTRIDVALVIYGACLKEMLEKTLSLKMSEKSVKTKLESIETICRKEKRKEQFKLYNNNDNK